MPQPKRQGSNNKKRLIPYRPKNRGSKEWSIAGKVVVITGANTGIGKSTALELARRGARRIILACRDLKKADEAANEIRQECDQSKTTIIVRSLDLSSLASVRRFAAEIIATEKVVNVLINNAGILGPASRTLSPDGNEMTFATNHLGPFLLTNLLLDLLKRSAPGRIVNVSSHSSLMWLHDVIFGLHLLDDPNLEKRYHWSAAYFRTKFANILFTQGLHKRLQGSRVTTYSLHPGVVGTEVTRDFGFLYRLLYPLVAKSPATGAQTSVYLATEPKIEHLSAGHFMDCKSASLPSFTDEMVEQLWQLSEKLTAVKV